MKSVNKQILLGRLGGDPEAHTFPDGNQQAKFSLATSEHYKDKDTGEKREITDWHNIVVAGHVCEAIGNYLRKGSKVYIEGRTRTRKWEDKEGNTRYTTECYVDRYRGTISFLDDRNSDSGQLGQRAAQPAAEPTQAEIDDDIPF